MFDDLNSGEMNPLIETDICIVGAGAAGISIAREFVGSNVSIILLESGNLEFDSKTQALSEGLVSGLSYPLATSYLRFFGGTTNHWAGQSTPLNPIDFKHRAWVPDSGWPIEYEDYARYLNRAQHVCKLSERPFEWEAWETSLNFPLDEETFHPIIFQYPDPIVRFGLEYREEIGSAENVRCIFNANATNIEVDSKGVVDYVEIKSLEGNFAKVRAKKFILACGAIQNVKLLLNSRNKSAQGLGNEHGRVGKKFMEHPWDYMGQVDLRDAIEYPMLANPRMRIQGIEIRSDFRMNEMLQEQFEILNHTMYLSRRRSDTFNDDLGGQVAKFWHKIEGKLNSYLGMESHTLRIRLEQAPSEKSWVGLSEERDAFGLNNVELHFELGELERHTVAVIQEEFAKALGARNIGRLKVNLEPGEKKWYSRLRWQNHLMGGTRMSKDPKEGVVDTNCKMHDVDNLYIASSSIFPTGGHANPTMNIIAFALRLSDHLKQGLKPS